MSAPTTKPQWVGTPVLDLILAADRDEMDADRIFESDHLTDEDWKLAEFLVVRAFRMRAEIGRRTGR